MKSFQFNWKNGNLIGVYQIPYQKDELLYKNIINIRNYNNEIIRKEVNELIAVVSASRKEEAIKKFAKEYKLPFKHERYSY